MELIHLAARAALVTYESHWAKRWIAIDHNRIRSASTVSAHRMHVDQLMKDIEAVVREVPVLA
jgi:hypothetical protein